MKQKTAADVEGVKTRSGRAFEGEILDLDGLIGGYNFQAAWSTGWLAGETAALL